MNSRRLKLYLISLRVIDTVGKRTKGRVESLNVVMRLLIEKNILENHSSIYQKLFVKNFEECRVCWHTYAYLSEKREAL